MYTEDIELIYEEEPYEGLFCEPAERTSDIFFPPVMNVLLLMVWGVICLIGVAVMFVGGNTIAGIVIIAVPTFIGMIIKPTFALCIMMLAAPSGAGVGYDEMFSLDRAIGIAVAVSFLLNIMITRPGIELRRKALWLMGIYTGWIILTSLAMPYLALEVRRAFTQLQLFALIAIVYWILQTNDEKTFRWALRAYVAGSLGTVALAFVSGAALMSAEAADARYSATAVGTIDPNMLAALTCTAFLTAIYLFARDKSIWRILHLGAMLLLPVMLLKIGSRGALVAIAFTLLSPLLFVRQVLRRPALAMLLVIVVVLASVSAGILVKTGGLQEDVQQRLTDVGYAEQSISIRMEPIVQAVRSVITTPAGTGYYSWFERTGCQIYPHNDFFFALGVYGVPAAVLFAVMVIVLMLAVKRTPLGLEKLYARAVLTFLLVMGMSIGQLFMKYFWIFMAFILAAERIGWLKNTED